MRLSTIFFLATSSITLALVAASGSGCQSNSSGGGGTGTGGVTNTNPTDTSTTNNTTTTDTDTDTGTGGTTGTTTTPTTGTGGSGPQVVTIQDITTNVVGPKVAVTVKGVVAMSHKFLVSQSKSTNSCLWGIFASAPGLSETAGAAPASLISRAHRSLPVATSRRVALNPSDEMSSALPSGARATAHTLSFLADAKDRNSLPVATAQTWTVPAASVVAAVLPSAASAVGRPR